MKSKLAGLEKCLKGIETYLDLIDQDDLLPEHLEEFTDEVQFRIQHIRNQLKI